MYHPQLWTVEKQTAVLVPVPFGAIMAPSPPIHKTLKRNLRHHPRAIATSEMSTTSVAPPAFTPTLPLHRPHSRPRSPTRPPRPLLLSTPTPSSLSALRTAVSTRRTTQLPTLLRHHLSQSPLDISLWRRAITVCLSSHDPDSASALLHIGVSQLPASRLHLSLLVAPLLALAKAGSWAHLLALLDRLHSRGPPAAPDERLLVSLANVAVDARMYNASLVLLDRVRDHGLTLGPVGYSVLLKSHGRATNVTEVKRAVANAFSGHVPVDSVLLNSAVDALVRCDDLRAASALIERPRYRHLVDVATFNTLIKGLARRGMVARAFAVLDDMRRAAVSPNDVTRNTLLQACVSAGDFDAAWRLADSVAETRADLPPVPAHQGDGQPPQLTIALTSLLAGLAEKGRVTDALALLRDMSRRNAPPSDITYAALIAACFRHGAVEEAIQVYKAIANPGLRTLGVVNAFVTGLCLTGEEGYLRLAADVVEGLLEKKSGESAAVRPNTETFNALLDGFMRARMFERAEHFLREMETQGCRPTIVSFTIMMKGYADARMFRMSKRMFREISRRGIEPDRVALSSFVNTCARSGDMRSALRVLEYMERKGGALSPGVYSYTPVIVAYLKESDVDKAWGTYERMRKNQVPLNGYLAELMTAHTLRLAAEIVKGEKKHVSMDAVAIAGANLLRDAHEDGVDVKVLRKCRRRMLGVFMDSKSKRHFRGLDYPEILSASETIFEKHGWNDIDSGWRVL